MAYIKKRTTLTLLLLLLLSIGLFIFSIFYYRGSFSRLTSVITQREDKIDRLSAELDSTRDNLTKTENTLDIQIMREENLTNLYGVLKAEKDKVETQKSAISKQLNETKLELFSAKIEISDLEDDIEFLNKKNSDLNYTYSRAINDINRICDKASMMNISECQKYN